MFLRFRLLILFWGAVAVTGAEIVYEKDIAPIFRTYCAGCHNDEERENGFSVETFASLRKGGEDKGDPIKPRHPEESFLIKSMQKQARPHMPPKDEPQVPSAEFELLKTWITAGAVGPKSDVSILRQITVPEIAADGQNRSPVTALAFSPDGKQIAVALNGRIELRNSLEGKARQTLDDIPGKINSIHYSKDGKQVVGSGGIAGLSGVARIWDLRSGKLVREIIGHRDALYDAEFSPDGKMLATAGYDRAIKLWSVVDGTLLRTIAVHNGAVFDLAFDPSGAVLASASADQTVKLWRVSDGLRLDTLNQPQGELNAVAFTPDGLHILAAGADKRIHMWKFVSREAPALNPVEFSRFAHEAPITALSLSADGKNLISSATDRTLKVWSLPDLEEQFAYETQPDIVSVVASLPRKNSFVAARMDGSLQTYSIKSAIAKKAGPARLDQQKLALSLSTNLFALTESEPNDRRAEASVITLPAAIKGGIERPGDTDLFRFAARAGEELAFVIDAAKSGSLLDSRLEILTTAGAPVEQVVLQATRDSWFTFRGKDSDTSDDFRLHNWAEMELDEYLYASGEVVKLWLYPRGPDSGFKVYPGEGKRQAAFSTTALSHALNEPAYVVKPLPAGSQPPPNGLPIFRLNFENDDDPSRLAGADSLLLFRAPATGDYLVHVTDVRGFGGTNYNYTLTARERRPDFSVALESNKPQVSPGSGREFRFVTTRREGFEGPIQIDVANLPPGFSVTQPIEIEAGQMAAVAAIYAAPDAKAPDTNAIRAVTITARADINGRAISHAVPAFENIALGPPAKLTVEILPIADASAAKPLEFSIRPGQTISARVRATRHDFKDRIELGNEDSGRNLPHGVFVDSIGLNGLLIVEGQTEREFFITASKIAKPGRRTFHLRARGDGGQVSPPAVLTVLPASASQVASQR